jgi:hypothetical protein
MSEDIVAFMGFIIMGMTFQVRISSLKREVSYWKKQAGFYE